MRRILPFVLVAVSVAGCGGGADSGSSPANPTPPSTGRGQRIAWTQSAINQAAVQGYVYVLYVDGARNPLTDATCTGAGPTFECSASLPIFPAGRHVLEIAAVDRSTGAESLRSEQLILGQSAAAAQSPTAVLRIPSESSPSNAADSIVSCAGASSACFSVSVIDGDPGPVQRLAALPDERLVASYGGGIARILPDGEAIRVNAGRTIQPATVADIAIDPDFISNRFVYFAAVTTPGDLRATASIVRMREVASTLGEAATIAADLPAAEGLPALSVGPDRRLYIALPASTRQPSATNVYDGLVLRLTSDGAAAGSERLGSPVLAGGTARPSSLAWVDSAHLLLASATANRGAELAYVGLGPEARWPAPIVPLGGASESPLTTGVLQVAAVAADPRSPLESRLLVLGAVPAALYVAQLSNDSEVVALNTLSLGSWTPLTFTVTVSGDVIVAARAADSAQVQLLRLHAQ